MHHVITWRRALAAAGTTAVAAIAVAGVLVPASAATHSSTAASSSGVAVTVDQGRLRGAAATNYDAWLGIPYAKPPVGALRWKSPKAPASWTGTRDATHFGNRCVQGTGWDPGYDTAKLNEDCLYLNVYAPTGSRKNLPVLVWIHGGGFTGGAGQDTNPRRYVQKNNAVVITINYRLGILGFLNLPQLVSESADGSGNFGLLDQQAALRWIQHNAGAFGGDAGNVTIAGQSAGGSSVCDQLASPTAAGLFAKAVIVSGGCSTQSAASGQASSKQAVQALGCARTRDTLACLRRVTPAQIVAAQADGVSVRPSLGGSAFPLDPAQAVATGKINRVPVINGQVQDERRLFVFQDYDYLGTPITAAQYPRLIRSTYGSQASAILNRYPLSAYPSPDIAFATLATDQASQTRAALDGQLAASTPTYAYEFNVEDTPQFASIFRLQQTNAAARAFDFGATHVDDLPYLFEYLGQTLPLTDDMLALSDQITDYWGNFQRTGNPNSAAVPTWVRFTGDSPYWLEERACSTDPGGNTLPGACSVSSKSYLNDHHVAFWQRLSS